MLNFFLLLIFISLNKNNIINCDNVTTEPNSLFTSRILEYEELVESLKNTILLLREYNPPMQIVFTVSPVRHTRDSRIINSRSKGLLLASIHKLVETYPDFVSYFPSYEYIIDELRLETLNVNILNYTFLVFLLFLLSFCSWF